MKSQTILQFKTLVVLVAGLMANTSLAQSNSKEYTFTTLAGGGGYITPNQAGTALRFNNPGCVAVNSVGTIYVADTFNHVIWKMSPQGAVTTLAGLAGSFGSADGLGGQARFYYPDRVATDSTGNVYVADSGNNTIRKVTPEGLVTTLAGLAGSFGSANGTGSVARFNGPEGLVVDSLGNIFVADLSNFTIRKVAPEGTNWVVTTIAGRPGQLGSVDGTGSTARFNWPQGLTMDGIGNLYVGDTDNSTIRKMAPVGTNWVVTTIAGLAGNPASVDGIGKAARLIDPKALAADDAGNIYVADEFSETIRQVTLVGTNWVVRTLVGSPLNPGNVDGTGRLARFNGPYGMTVGSAGNLYVADPGNNAIREVKPVGTNWVVTTLAGLGGVYGSADGVGRTGLFRGPSAIAVDGAGSLYVADQGNHTIREVTSEAVVKTLNGLAGYGGIADGTNDVAKFNSPAGIAVDSKGDLYVADGANTIRKATRAGANWVVTTLAGRQGDVGSDDGTGKVARFNLPKGLAVDRAGNLFVADSGNHIIRRMTPSGAVITVAGRPEIAGSNDGIGLNARFNNPSGVAVDSATNLYVADTWNHTIRKVTPFRSVTTLAGLAGTPGDSDGLGADARFNYPCGVAVDSAGNVYVADTYNNTIRKLTPAGTNWVVRTLGGAPGFWGSADGRGSVARFSNPNSLAVDGDGNIYVADYYLNSIRKGSPPPIILNAGFTGGQFSFILAGPTGQAVVVESSTDLLNWLPLWTNSFVSALNFSDAKSSASAHRFYRAHVP